MWSPNFLLGVYSEPASVLKAHVSVYHISLVCSVHGLVEFTTDKQFPASSASILNASCNDYLEMTPCCWTENQVDVVLCALPSLHQNFHDSTLDCSAWVPNMLK